MPPHNIAPDDLIDNFIKVLPWIYEEQNVFLKTFFSISEVHAPKCCKTNSSHGLNKIIISFLKATSHFTSLIIPETV